MSAKAPAESFGVYCAGETIDGTDISITYVYISTPLGQVRMTAEEAEILGRCLIAAADYDRRSDNEDQAATVGKRHRLTPEHLKAVATVYLQALKNGDGPTRAVANHFGIPHSTAAKWVARARREGDLNPTIKGIAR